MTDNVNVSRSSCRGTCGITKASQSYYCIICTLRRVKQHKLSVNNTSNKHREVFLWFLSLTDRTANMLSEYQLCHIWHLALHSFIFSHRPSDLIRVKTCESTCVSPICFQSIHPKLQKGNIPDYNYRPFLAHLYFLLSWFHPRLFQTVPFIN